MTYALDAAFIIALIAFTKEQLGLKGRVVLLWVFVVALLFGVGPLIAQSFPISGPYIKVLLDTVILFIGSAGSYDAVVAFKRAKAK